MPTHCPAWKGFLWHLDPHLGLQQNALAVARTWSGHGFYMKTIHKHTLLLPKTANNTKTAIVKWSNHHGLLNIKIFVTIILRWTRTRDIKFWSLWDIWNLKTSDSLITVSQEYISPCGYPCQNFLYIFLNHQIPDGWEQFSMAIPVHSYL